MRYDTKTKKAIRQYFKKTGIVYLLNMDIIEGFHYIEIKSKEMLEICFSKGNILKSHKSIDKNLKIVKG